MPSERELTFRALFSGVLLGALLTPSNLYSGLKIGWSFNMSIIALLVSYGTWQGLVRCRLGTPWSLRESNINQTTASAAASIVAGGLVAPIPAYTLLTGQQLPTLPLIAWVFSVSFLGIWVAWYLRRSMVEDSGLRFPEAAATLETMQQVYAYGRDALQRLYVLGGAALLGGAVKWLDSALQLPRWSPGAGLERLTFNLDPSPLLLGFGGIIGIRVGLSLLIGALLAWGGLAPWLIASGLVSIAGDATGPQFAPLVEWLLWPGVSLLVCATLTALALRYRASRRRSRASAARRWTAPARLPLAMLGLASLMVVALQVWLFDIALSLALLSIPLAVLLACMAARVVGATGIPPIGATGQLSQLTFGLVAPGQVGINLMAANTAGGAAGQCTDLLNDFRVGHAIGARPGNQLLAQCLGIAVGSLVGVLVYQVLIPDPQAMLISEQWPAPAVATWKAVAEVLGSGLDALDTSIRWAMLGGALVGVLFGVLEATPPLHSRLARWLPSSAAFGLAFIIPASISLMMCIGALLAWVLQSRWRSLGERFTLAAAAGLVAGESIVGVGASFWMMFASG